MNKTNINERINDLIKNFVFYANHYKDANPFTGPSDYFYGRIMKIIKDNPDYNTLFNDGFIELIYASLSAWGMDRMGPPDKGPKMNNFMSFKQCLVDSRQKFVALSTYKIKECVLDADLEEKLLDLYVSLGALMKSNSKLVATSKTMHFILPQLMAPMDRQYTMEFFGQNLPTIKSQEDDKNIKKEIGIFLNTFHNIQKIAHNVDWTGFKFDESVPTIPKAIDNAIVGFIREKQKIRKARLK